MKRVTWEESKRQKAAKEKQKAQAARLRALQASNNSGGASRFADPDVSSTIVHSQFSSCLWTDVARSSLTDCL